MAEESHEQRARSGSAASRSGYGPWGVRASYVPVTTETQRSARSQAGRAVADDTGGQRDETACNGSCGSEWPGQADPHDRAALTESAPGKNRTCARGVAAFAPPPRRFLAAHFSLRSMKPSCLIRQNTENEARRHTRTLGRRLWVFQLHWRGSSPAFTWRDTRLVPAARVARGCALSRRARGCCLP